VFKVEQNSPEDQKILNNNTGEVYDLVQELSFSSELDSALENHASKQAYWESMAIELTRGAQEFESVGHAKWTAHSRYYAKLALKGMGEERILLDDIRDTVIRIYSSDTRKDDRDTYCQYAMQGLLMTENSSNASKIGEAKKDPSYSPRLSMFRKQMFSYLDSEKNWTFEKVTQLLLSLREQAEKLKSVAKAFDKRSYSMKELVDLEKAKYGNIGPLTIQEVVDEVTKKVERKLNINPEENQQRALMERLSAQKEKGKKKNA